MFTQPVYAVVGVTDQMTGVIRKRMSLDCKPISRRARMSSRLCRYCVRMYACVCMCVCMHVSVCACVFVLRDIF